MSTTLHSERKVHAPPRRSERRVSVRYSTDFLAYCEPAAAKTATRTEARWSAQVRNISAGGIGLVLARRFERGTVLMVELTDRVEGGSRHVPVRVVHTTAAGQGHWILGCSFVRTMNEEELDALRQAD
jgi:hypothetical protein